jgi:hypothetical protein
VSTWPPRSLRTWTSCSPDWLASAASSAPAGKTERTGNRNPLMVCRRTRNYEHCGTGRGEPCEQEAHDASDRQDTQVNPRLEWPFAGGRGGERDGHPSEKFLPAPTLRSKLDAVHERPPYPAASTAHGVRDPPRRPWACGRRTDGFASGGRRAGPRRRHGAGERPARAQRPWSRFDHTRRSDVGACCAWSF